MTRWLCGIVVLAGCAKTTSVKARLASSHPSAGVGRDVGNSASSDTSGLQELRYLFGQMSLCEDLEINGSQFNGGTNCTTLYDSGVHGDLDQLTAADLQTHAADAVDLASAASIEAFNSRSAGHIAAGSYNYVTVNWAPLIAVKAAVQVGDTSVVTQACTLDAGSGLCTASQSLSSASATEAIVRSANGGTWFKFQKPFVVTAADVDAGATFAIDLVFDPNGAVAASTHFDPANSGNDYFGTVSDAAPPRIGNAIYVPMIQLTPMPRKSSDTTSRETYTVTLPDSMGHTRVELYFDKSDTTRTIYGVNVITLLTTSDGGGFMQIDAGAKVATLAVADGLLTLKGTDGNATIAGLTRDADGTVTVTQMGGAPASASYTYDGTSDL